jgi:hypothetical protein
MGKAKKQDAAAPVVDADDAVFQQRALELKGANHNSPAVFPFSFRLVPRVPRFFTSAKPWAEAGASRAVRRTAAHHDLQSGHAVAAVADRGRIYVRWIAGAARAADAGSVSDLPKPLVLSSDSTTHPNPPSLLSLTVPCPSASASPVCRHAPSHGDVSAECEQLVL